MKTKKLNINQIKKKLLQWEDFYGQDLLNIDDIKKCKTKSDCLIILQLHRRFQEDQSIEAGTHLDSFITELGL